MLPTARAGEKKTGLAGWLLLVPLLAGAQNAFSPGGYDYRIAGALPGDQVFPQVVVNTNGGYLVWQDNSLSTNGLRINAERLDSSFIQLGPLFAVSAYSSSAAAGDQEKPKLALLNDGGAVFVWQGGRYGFQKIYARFLAANGVFTTSDILVNTYTNNFQIDPAVATLSDGSVIVVWSSYGEDGDLQGIYGQRLSAAGAKLGGEFQINQFYVHNQRTPAVAALANTNFVVTWVSELERASASVDIYGRIYTGISNGVSAVGNEFPLNTSTSNMCANPQVAGSPQGGFAVVWSQNDSIASTVGSQNGVQISESQTLLSSNSWDVFGRLFNANGTAAGAPVRLNTYTYGDQYAPRISAFGKDYLTVWISLGQDSSWEGIFGQFLTGSGEPQGVEFRVNSTTISRQLQPCVASDGVSRFLVVWSSFGAGTSFDLWARSYDLIRLQLTSTPQGLKLMWNTAPGLVYQVQVTTGGGVWSDTGAARTATGYSDWVTLIPSNGTAYYRVIRRQ